MKIAISEELTVKTVSGVAQMLDDQAQSGLNVELHTSQITKIDTLGVQLLLIFKLRFDSENRSLTWVDPSEPLVRIAEELGVSELMGLHRHST